VRVSRTARVRVGVLRARGSRAPRRVRTLALPARRRHVRTLRARALRRGSYVLRVVAVDGSGRRSAVIARRLRVR